MDSVVVTETLDWKLHAFDVLSEFEENNEASTGPIILLEGHHHELLIPGVSVDGYSRTNIPSIRAISDVTNRMNLTLVALMEGTCFAKTVFGGQPTKPDYGHIPCAVFCSFFMYL
ncbi:hypothetical protein OROMI_016854 [Orobanche minor]